ncbi:hypothetical protein ACFQV8_12075 [Pseudonocardia benzenivorans]
MTIDGQGPGPAAGPGLALRPEDRGPRTEERASCGRTATTA